MHKKWDGVSLEELKKRARALADELYALRQEISFREGDVPKAVDVDFEKYITK